MKHDKQPFSTEEQMKNWFKRNIEIYNSTNISVKEGNVSGEYDIVIGLSVSKKDILDGHIDTLVQQIKNTIDYGNGPKL